MKGFLIGRLPHVGYCRRYSSILGLYCSPFLKQFKVACDMGYDWQCSMTVAFLNKRNKERPLSVRIEIRIISHRSDLRAMLLCSIFIETSGSSLSARLFCSTSQACFFTFSLHYPEKNVHCASFS